MSGIAPEYATFFPPSTHPNIPRYASSVLSTLRSSTGNRGTANELRPEQRAALAGISAILACERYGTEDVTLEYARKRSATTRSIFQSTLAQCRDILASSRTTPSKSKPVSSASQGRPSPSALLKGSPSSSTPRFNPGANARDPLAIGGKNSPVVTAPNPFLSPSDKDKSSKPTPRTPPLSPFGRQRLDLSGLRRNTNGSTPASTSVSVADAAGKASITDPGSPSSGPLSVPSPFLAMSPNASSSQPREGASHGGPASSRIAVPTTPTKTRMVSQSDKILSPLKGAGPNPVSTSETAVPIAPSPSRRGNASPMHNSLLKAKAELVRRAGFAAIDEEDELGLGPVDDGGSPSKRRKFRGQGVDLESAIKSSSTGSLVGKQEPASPSSSSKSKKKLQDGLRAREPSPVRPTVDMLQLVLPPASTSVSPAFLASPYVSIYHPPLTYSGVANHVLPTAQDRIFAKTVPSAEYAWGPSFMMESKGGHGYLDRELQADGNGEMRETWKRLDMADKRRKRAMKRRRRLMKSLQEGLAWQAEEEENVEAVGPDDAMRVGGERDRKRKRAEVPRWESEFGIGQERAGDNSLSWHDSIRTAANHVLGRPSTEGDTAPATPWDPKQATWLTRAESKGIAVRVWSGEGAEST